MSDELDDLKRALHRGPAPDADQKARTIAAAREIFEENFAPGQDPAVGTRPTLVRPRWAFLTGVRQMFATTQMRGALAGTTAVVALGFVALTPTLQTLAPPPVIPAAKQSATDAILTEPTVMQDRMADAPAMAPSPAPMTASRSFAREQMAGGLAMTEAESGLPVPSDHFASGPRTEEFANADSAPLRVTAEDPVSTFSVDVDTASYAVVRNSLNRGVLPPPDAVRIEEMVNYFPYDHPVPTDGAAFQPTVSVMDTPWNAGTRLIHIALQGATVTERPPLNLVFLIDTSGSMQDAAKLPLLKQSFRLMLGALRPEDEIAIVTYAGSAGQVLAPTAASDRDVILAALDQLQAGGSTAGQAGLQQAYATAATMQADGEVARVVLATDGDFNVGLSDPEALKDFIAEQRDSGVYLNVLGFGRGNLDDATMQALAQNGNGQAAYIDTLSEARKVLVDQLDAALVPIASDVKVQVEFNPATVAEYRLIGYETRALRREDFNNDRVDAGDIGSGHQVTAIYEVTPVGSDARLTDPLRYGADTAGPAGELGFLKLRWKQPGAEDSTLKEMPIPLTTGPIPDDARFSVAIAGFGQLLRDSVYLGGWRYADAIALASASKGADPFGYRQEAITLMRLAEALDPTR